MNPVKLNVVRDKTAVDAVKNLTAAAQDFGNFFGHLVERFYLSRPGGPENYLPSDTELPAIGTLNIIWEDFIHVRMMPRFSIATDREQQKEISLLMIDENRNAHYGWEERGYAIGTSYKIPEVTRFDTVAFVEYLGLKESKMLSSGKLTEG